MLTLRFGSSPKKTIDEVSNLTRALPDQHPLKLKAKYTEYSVLYEDYLLDFLANFLRTQKVVDLATVPEKFIKSVVIPHSSNLYCNQLVKNIVTGLDTLKDLTTSSSVLFEQNLYEFMLDHSDKFLQIQSIAYIINVGERSAIHSYTSSTFIKKHGLNVIKTLSNAQNGTISAYKYNYHWYLVFKESGKHFVIDPNQEKEDSFRYYHETLERLNVKYIPLDINQSNIADTLGTCGKICIALYKIFTKFFIKPNLESISELILNIKLDFSFATKIETEIASIVLDLVKEDSPYYFESLGLLSKQNYSDDIYHELKKMYALRDTQHNAFQIAQDKHFKIMDIVLETLENFCQSSKFSNHDFIKIFQLIQEYSCDVLVKDDAPLLYVEFFNFKNLLQQYIFETGIFKSDHIGKTSKIIDIINSYYGEIVYLFEETSEASLTGEESTIVVAEG
ncbi:MAG: hypothetical protein AB8B68_00020 [Rickettsiaceae bacterium]